MVKKRTNKEGAVKPGEGGGGKVLSPSKVAKSSWSVCRSVPAQVGKCETVAQSGNFIGPGIFVSFLQLLLS